MTIHLSAIAVAVAAVAVLALAACGGPGVEVVATVAPTATATRVPVPTATAGPFESDRISCTPEVLADRSRVGVVMTEVMERYLQAFASIPGVGGVGIGVLVENGVAITRLGIKIHFDTAFDDISPEYRESIPAFVEGCPVHVKLGGKIVAN